MIAEAKKELLNDMRQMDFCTESLTAVENSQSIRDLCTVLRTFKTDLKGVSFPRIEWFRRWFSEEEQKQELARNGVFVDVEMALCTFMRCVFVYGNSKLAVSVKDRRMMFLNIFNDATVQIHDSGRGLYHIELVDDANFTPYGGKLTKFIISDKR